MYVRRHKSLFYDGVEIISMRVKTEEQVKDFPHFLYYYWEQHRRDVDVEAMKCEMKNFLNSRLFVSILLLNW